MFSYIYAPFLPNFSLGVLNPHVLVCGFLLLVPSGQRPGKIAPSKPARVAKHSAGFDSSCLLTELDIHKGCWLLHDLISFFYPFVLLDVDADGTNNLIQQIRLLYCWLNI